MLLILTVLLMIIIRMYKKKGVTTSFIIICFYVLSTILGILYKRLFPNQVPDYSLFSMVYYVLCLVVFLIPLIHNNNDWRDYFFPQKLLNFFSVVIIVGGFIILYSDIVNFDVNRLNMSWLDQRNEYYFNYQDDIIYTKWYDRISSNIRHMMLFSLPLFYYHLSRGNKWYSILMGIASMSIFAMSIMNASRQEFILWIVGAVYSYLFFKSGLSKNAIRGVNIFLIVFGSIAILLVIIITLSRFGGSSGRNTFSSFLNYSGVQPYNAAMFLEDLSSQAQWGLINFPYLRGVGAVKVINDYINAPYYLNVFGSLVGSFYLDFGYFTIIIVLLYALMFDKLLAFYRSRNSFAYFYLFFIYCDIIFSGLFYYRYISFERIRILLFFFIVIIIYEQFANKRKI